MDRVRSCLAIFRKVTVEPVMFLYMLGTFLQFPVLQAFLIKKVCLGKFDKTVCDNLTEEAYVEQDSEVQASASQWIMLYMVCLLLPSIVAVLFFASWSDKISKKATIIVPCIGSIIGTVGNLLNAVHMDGGLGFVLIPPLIHGLLGGFVTMMMSVYSYVSCVSSAETRTVRMAILEVATYFAAALGMLVSGPLLAKTSFVFIFAACGVIFAFSIVYTVFCIHELVQNTSEVRGKKWLSLLFNTEHIKESITCVFKSREDNKRVYLLIAILVLAIFMLATTGEGDVSLLYLQHKPLSFSNEEYGYVKGVQDFVRSLLVLILIPLLKQVWSIKDTILIFIGLVSKVVGLIILGSANHNWMVYVAAVTSILQGLPAPALRSIMSRMINKDEQGKLFGVVAASENIATFLGSLIFNGIYSRTLDTVRGLCFYVGAILLFLGGLFIVYVHVSLKRQNAFHELISAPNDEDSEDVAAETGEDNAQEPDPPEITVTVPG